MKLNQVKTILSNSKTISFQLPDGTLVPNHFHVTEIAKIKKDFIDCGGKIRHEERVAFQLWEADDYDHRLHPEKLTSIIELAQDKLGIEDLEVEVEYQGTTINKFALDHDGQTFTLVSKQTDCLAREGCLVPEESVKHDLSAMAASTCTPGGGCC